MRIRANFYSGVRVTDLLLGRESRAVLSIAKYRHRTKVLTTLSIKLHTINALMFQRHRVSQAF